MNDNQRDDLWERLTDLALREVVGGKQPQQSKSQIGDIVPASRVASAPEAAAGKGKRSASAEQAGWMRPEDGPRRSALRVLVVATCLLVGLTLVIVINRAAGDRPWLWPVAKNDHDFDSLTDSILSTVEPESWREVGGPGQVEGFSGHLSLTTQGQSNAELRSGSAAGGGKYGSQSAGGNGQAPGTARPRTGYAVSDGDVDGFMVFGKPSTSGTLYSRDPEPRLRGDSGAVDAGDLVQQGVVFGDKSKERLKVHLESVKKLIKDESEVEDMIRAGSGTPLDPKPTPLGDALTDGTSATIVNTEVDGKVLLELSKLKAVAVNETVALAVRAVTGKEADPDVVKKFLERAKDGRGVGPGQGGDRYQPINENRFLGVGNNPLSTFSIDVDTASYSKVRRLLFQHHELPPPDAVRLEEFINYHVYNYAGPEPAKADAAKKPSAKSHPFAVHGDVAACPWQPGHKLLRIAIKGREIKNEDRPPSNLVFLVDVSGSMDEPDRLPLVKKGLKNLVQRLRATDRVAIVVYAGAAGLVLPSTPGNEKVKIMSVLDELQPQGSTNGAQGIHLAYDIAAQNFIKGGTNRVILATDGDFNVGTTSDAELVRLVEKRAKEKVFLTTLGVGIGNHNDAMLQQIADKGNGQCFYLDSELEADKVLVQQIGGTLVTIAKDVKIQVEFNPAKVAAYRLLGYEKRLLRTEDFADDTKDAGEIGAGHTVTALYEIVPVPHEPLEAPARGAAEVEPTGLKYQKPAELTAAAATAELLTVHMRYKQPEADKSEPLDIAVNDADVAFGKAPGDFQFAAAVASFAMILRNSQYRGLASYDKVLELAAGGLKDDEHGYRDEFVEMVKRAKEIADGGKPK